MKFLKSKSLAALSLALIVTLLPQRVDGASPPKDPFANFMQMRDYASVHKYRAINKTLYFQKDGQSGRFERKMNPKRINPYVNSQIYNATVSLLHGKYYTSTSYMPKNDTIPSRVIMSFSPAEAFALSGSTAFYYIFYDEKADLYNSHLTLTTNRLWYNDVSELNKDHAEAVYKAKLQNSIFAIFDEKEEKQIFEFVFSEYLKSAKRQTKDGTVRKKKFGNINVVMEKRTVPTFYFSYVRKP